MLAPVASASFENDIEHIEILAATPVTNATLLARNLNYIYERASKARFSDYDVAGVARAAPSLIYRLFDLRVGLREHLPHYEMLGLMTPEVTQGVSRCLSDSPLRLGHARRDHHRASARQRRRLSAPRLHGDR